jgi:hypothetical protein
MANRYWFRRKSTGWGWVAISSEGRIATYLYIVALFGWLAYMWIEEPLYVFGVAAVYALYIPVLGLTILLLLLNWWKSEPV